MRETRLRWFGHVQSEAIDPTVRKIEYWRLQMLQDGEENIRKLGF